MRQNVRQRGLAQPRRAEQQHVVERFATRPGGGDEDVELLANLALADVFVQLARPQRAFQRFFAAGSRRRRDQPRIGGRFGKLVGLDAHDPSLADLAPPAG